MIILIIENDKLWCEYLFKLLKKYGYDEILISSTWKEAFSIIQEKNPFKIILDLHLGNSIEDGFFLLDLMLKHNIEIQTMVFSYSSDIKGITGDCYKYMFVKEVIPKTRVCEFSNKINKFLKFESYQKNQKQIFISYAKEDFDIAHRLYKDLKKDGFIPWIDKEDLIPGQNWKVVISDAIAKSSYFIAIISLNSISKKGYVQKELKIALDIVDEFPSSEIFIIPVRIENCTPSDQKLCNYHWADLFPLYKKGYDSIVKSLN